MVKIADAKMCDRCKGLYEIPSNDEMEYNVHKKKIGILDLCPDCKFALEDFMTNPKSSYGKKIRKKRTHSWSNAAKEKQSARMKEVQEIAARLKEENSAISHHDAIAKASKLLKENDEQIKLEKSIEENKSGFEKMLDDKEKKEKVKKKEYKCTICLTTKVDEPHEMCGECDMHMMSNPS